MAFTYEKILDDNLGNCHMVVYKCTFTSVTEGIINTGYNNVLAAHSNNETTEADGYVQKNVNGSGASYGDVKLSGFTSNDEATLTVFAI